MSTCSFPSLASTWRSLLLDLNGPCMASIGRSSSTLGSLLCVAMIRKLNVTNVTDFICTRECNVVANLDLQSRLKAPRRENGLAACQVSASGGEYAIFNIDPVKKRGCIIGKELLRILFYLCTSRYDMAATSPK